MAPRFLIDENLSPVLVTYMVNTLGVDAVHVHAAGLTGASDDAVIAYAVREDRIVMTANGEDFRRLAKAVVDHPGLAIVLDADGRARQIVAAEALVQAVDATIAGAGIARGRVFEVGSAGKVRVYLRP